MRMKSASHWWARGIGVAVAVCVSGLGVSGKTESVDACIYQCASGGGVSCQPNEHKVWGDPVFNAAGEPHGDCHIGTCAEYHACPPAPGASATPFEIAESVSRAVRNNDAGTLASLLTKEPKTVTVNRARAAFQVTNCAGEVILHLPGQTGLIGAVLSALSPTQ